MTNEKCLVSLNEFSIHTKLSSDDILYLLERGELPCEISENGSLKIDVSKISLEIVAQRVMQARMNQVPKMVVGEDILKTLEPVFEQAIQLAITWIKQDQEAS